MVKIDKSMGVSQLLWENARAAPKSTPMDVGRIVRNAWSTGRMVLQPKS